MKNQEDSNVLVLYDPCISEMPTIDRSLKRLKMAIPRSCFQRIVSTDEPTNQIAGNVTSRHEVVVLYFGAAENNW